MNGYLQCLIDQYESKFNKAIGGMEKNIYREILVSLNKFQRYIEDPQESTVKKIPKKHIAFDFVGTMPGLMEYLKNLSLEQGDIK